MITPLQKRVEAGHKDTYDQYIERCLAGEEKVSAETFARSAIGTLPRIETKVAKLTNYRAWGFSSQAEMDAALAEGATDV